MIGKRISMLVFPRNHTTRFCGWVPINATIEMMPHGKGLIEFKAFVMRILYHTSRNDSEDDEELEIQVGDCQ